MAMPFMVEAPELFVKPVLGFECNSDNLRRLTKTEVDAAVSISFEKHHPPRKYTVPDPRTGEVDPTAQQSAVVTATIPVDTVLARAKCCLHEPPNNAPANIENV